MDTGLHHAAAVLEMLEAQALCTALPPGLEVHYPSMAEQEELLLQLLAARDATGALSPDEPTLELTPEEISACASPLELVEDF
ncbi:hypothetical protein C0989_012412 [Termitomyces sp. Mn162]|nr:hypothetical protein C0989_012412 [Termitomyces sp. Mn162]